MVMEIAVKIRISAYFKSRAYTAEVIKTKKRYRYLTLYSRFYSEITVCIHIEYVTVVARHNKSVDVY